MPQPLRIEAAGGPPLPHRPLAVAYAGVRTDRLGRAAERFTGRRRATGEALPMVVDCASESAVVPGLDDDESYSLETGADGVRIRAPAEWGVLRALATLTQLSAGPGETPALRIEDAPRFAWRGLMLDVARHFIPCRDLLRTLDAMELVKLNVLHLHLSDDQGFRFPSARYPRLASDPHYERGELRALVEEAARRGVRVVPELDVPGHATSWLTAYPEWGSRRARPSRRFGVHGACLDPSRAGVREAVAAVFAELADVFPDAYLHLGGDEVAPGWWSEDPDVRRFMAQQGLADAPALQAWFNGRLCGAIAGLGRRPMGWDEVLHPAAPESVTVQAWRGATSRDRALAAGHDCVVSAPYYLDLFYPADVHYGFDPAAPQQELLDREDALLEDPRFAHVADGLAWTRQWRDDKVDHVPDDAGRVLGAEACLWSELVDGRVLDVRLWSRMPALAERFWSAAGCRDVPDMYRRLDGVLAALPGWCGVDVMGDARRLAADAGVSGPWQALVAMLEPVKWYGRLLGEEALAARLQGREMPRSRPYDADTPLDRVVDALPPESPAVRRLSDLTEREAAGDTVAREALEALAEQWRALPADGGPAELAVAAERLRALGTMIAALLAGDVSPADARQTLAEAAPPMGEYLLAVVPVLARWLVLRSGPGR